MGWKDWPYWLKGGIVFSIIAILLHVFLYILLLKYGGTGFILGNHSGLIYIPFFTIFIFGAATVGFGGLGIFGLLFWIIVNGLFHFIIGAIIGWIYGKIRGKTK